MNRSPLAIAAPFLAVSAFALLASACMDTPTEFACTGIENQQRSVHGDSVLTTSGLIYRDLEVGSGAAVLSSDECQTVRVEYTGRLEDGTVFSASPAGQTFAFIVGRHLIIAGLEQGMVGMRVGGTRQMIIPPELGYGEVSQRDNAGNVVIPAGSTLIFDVTLVGVGE